MIICMYVYIQGVSNMTRTDLCVNKPHCAATVRPWESEATTSTLPPAWVRGVRWRPTCARKCQLWLQKKISPGHIWTTLYIYIYIYTHTHTLTHMCVYIHTHIHPRASQNIADDIGTRLRTGPSGFRITTEQLVSLFSVSSRSALGSAQPPIRWEMGFFPGCKPVAAWSWLLTYN